MVQIRNQSESEAAKSKRKFHQDEGLYPSNDGAAIPHLVEPQDRNLTHEY